MSTPRKRPYSAAQSAFHVAVFPIEGASPELSDNECAAIAALAGLTKREWIAINILSGIVRQHPHNPADVQLALAYADDLLAALENPPE